MSNLVALIGLPNSGKSALFNSLTGSRQRVANFPGITVEKKKGKYYSNDKIIEVMDLPGIYSLNVNSLDEKVSRDFIFDRLDTEENADIFVLVVDSTNLEKSLYLALQLKDIGRKVVVALNMFDAAEKRGLKLNIDKLSQHLNTTIVTTVAVDDRGIQDLKDVIEKEIQNDKITIQVEKNFFKEIGSPEYIKNKIADVKHIIDDVVESPLQADSLTEKIDRLILHPVLGLGILFLTLVFTFQLMFEWATPFQDMIDNGVGMLGDYVGGAIPQGLLNSFVVDGIIAGVGGVLVFVPHIFLLFVLIMLLEDIGYLGRAAFLLDYLMRRLGLPGKAVIPLLSSHACAIPGIMAARIIDDPKERLITMLVAPLTSCSARLPVYTLLIAALVPNITVFGIFSLPALIMFGLFSFGIVAAFIVAFIFRKTAFSGEPSFLMMELPAYRLPRFKSLIINAWGKVNIFLKKAGTVILVLSMVIWVLVTFPKAPEDATEPAINYSAAATIGKTFQPLFAPLGFDWKITTALIPSFAAREVLVSAMGTVMAVNENEEDEEQFTNSLKEQLAKHFSLGTLLALLIWFVFSPQCISTFGILRRETGGWKWPGIVFAYSLGIAYFFSFVAYQIGNAIQS